jgi:hypothetical protein
LYKIWNGYYGFYFIFISFLIAWEAQCDTSFPPQPLCASMFYTSGSQPGVHDLLGGTQKCTILLIISFLGVHRCQKVEKRCSTLIMAKKVSSEVSQFPHPLDFDPGQQCIYKPWYICQPFFSQLVNYNRSCFLWSIWDSEKRITFTK